MPKLAPHLTTRLCFALTRILTTNISGTSLLYHQDETNHLQELATIKSPRGRLDQFVMLPRKSATDEKGRHRDAEKQPLEAWPGGLNPNTGEQGGPKGPEPTRYGDWERKGRVTDF